MKTSESIMNLSAALLAAASKIRPLVKDSNNPFFNSKYADVNQTIEALKSVLLNNDVWFMQFPHSTENSVGGVTRVMHSSGEFMEHEYVYSNKQNDIKTEIDNGCVSVVIIRYGNEFSNYKFLCMN